MQRVERAWEWRFAASPDKLWPILADTARFNEAVGLPRYTVTDTPLPDGSVQRIGSARRFGVTLCWEEGVPQWIAGRRFFHERRLRSRLLRRVANAIEIDPDGDGGSRVRYRAAFDAAWPVALLLRLGGLARFGEQLDRLFRAAAAIAETSPELGFGTAPEPVPAAVRARVAAIAQGLAERGYTAAAPLAAYILDRPETDLERMRPRALARYWHLAPRLVIETCLAAVREGLLSLRWDLVCPRCRGAKVAVSSLDQLPRGAHCPSCNIDYDRDFAGNVEVTFEPAAGVRALGAGSYCIVSPLAIEHVKIQHTLAPGETVVLAADLAEGDYRARTLEPGGAVDFSVVEGMVPAIDLTDDGPELGGIGAGGEVRVRNAGSHTRTLVIEDRNWARDALTAQQATTMQAFRDLFADAVLRPGDEVAIRRIALLFTDIKGSSDLYNRVGDARAYGWVREHYAVLTRAVREHDGAVVKTIGDAVMAAFDNPAGALAAAVAIRDDIAAFDREVAAAAGADVVAIAVKLGLHAGPCIAVTLNDRLDYFGRTVNLAARLQGESRGGDIVLSEAMAVEPDVAARLADLAPVEETAQVKGFAEPVRLYRIPAPESSAIGDQNSAGADRGDAEPVQQR
jgi:class 3 adenylate cyclase